MVAANLAGWYGNASTPEYLFPFAAVFGGLAQFLAGMWAYKARDAIATAMHGMWGSYWIGYGILFLLVATGTLDGAAVDVPLGYWFIGLTAITLMGAIGAMSENVALSVVLHTLWVGVGCLAIGFLTTTNLWVVIGGYVLILSAICAWYTGSALMLEGAGRPILPIGKTAKAREKAEPWCRRTRRPARPVATTRRWMAAMVTDPTLPGNGWAFEVPRDASSSRGTSGRSSLPPSLPSRSAARVALRGLHRGGEKV